ncbi:hypothetical protein ACRS8P_27740 [Burkholderia cenocepacia]
MTKATQDQPTTARRLTTAEAALPLGRSIAEQQPVQPTPPTNASGQRFVLPDVMRNWPILDERDRAPSPPSYGADAG